MLDYQDALYCWNLVDSHDYIILFLLRGNPAIPKLFGFFRHLFVHELFHLNHALLSSSFKKETRSWQLKARLAVALIKMVEALEHTQYSRLLYMCDVKGQNFGIVEKQASENVLRARPVDFDMTWFECMRAELCFKKPSPCSDFYDCSIIQCLAGCDHQSTMCSKEIIFSNNLQVREQVP